MRAPLTALTLVLASVILGEASAPAFAQSCQALWVERKLAQGGPDAIAAYRAEHNVRSIDGLPALDG